MPKTKTEFSLPGLALDAGSSLPLYRQVYDAFRGAILAGRLQPGEKLPPTRDLASILGISRTTILLAFDHLLSEGYVEGRTGSGTYVTETIPEQLLQTRQEKSVHKKAKTPPRLSRRGQAIAATDFHKRRNASGVRPFRPGIPSLRDFPFELWSRLSAKHLRLLHRDWFGYGDPAGYPPLRHAIARHLRLARAARCEAEQIIIVSGSQQALDLAARVLLDSGDRIWLEEPGYPGARATMIAAGIQPIPVTVDAEGMAIDNAPKTADRIRMACVSPSHQYPLGVTMSLSRRLCLLQWAAASGAWILEDDYDSEYRYAGQPLTSLQGLDENDRVIYMGTFSKVLFPGLRLGYLVAPDALVGAFTSAKAVSDRCNSIVAQATLASFIDEGYFGRHIRKMRLVYQARQEIFRDAIKHELGELLTLKPADTGLHLVGWLSDETDALQVANKAAAAGIDVPPLADYYITDNARNGLVLGYAAFDEDEIRSGVETLAGVIMV